MFRIKIISALAMVILLASCRHDTDLTNVPVVHFSVEVQTILSGNCTMSGCHEGDSQFSLIGYDNVMSYVKPNDARGSKLYRSVTGRDGGIMPPSSRPSLTNKQLEEIYIWIEQGALNN